MSNIIIKRIRHNLASIYDNMNDLEKDIEWIQDTIVEVENDIYELQHQINNKEENNE